MTKEQRSRVSLLVDENIGLVDQGIDLISSVDPAAYANNEHDLFSGGVGKHFRHVLDFYDRLVGGYATLVDYNARGRDERIETDPDYAIRCARTLCGAMRAIAEAPAVVRVASEVLGPDGAPLVADSSLERELSVLASHTIHHYAIIALLLRIQGQSVPGEFGVAPSTLRYRASQGS